MAERKGSIVHTRKRASILEDMNALNVHTYAEEEVEAFMHHINSCLDDDKDLKSVLPTEDIFEAQKSGILLCKLINCAAPNTIDERAINKGDKLSVFKVAENQNLAINSAKAIGCRVVNIGANELAAGDKTLILGLVWQVIKIQLLANISLKDCPELYRLLEDGEELSVLMSLPPEALLLRWFNFHLKEAGSEIRVKNFGRDLKNSEAYSILLKQLAPEKCNKDAMKETDLMNRAEVVLQNAEAIKCRKFVKPKDIVAGNPKLNLAFVATIFNTLPGLKPLEKAEIDAAGLLDDDEGDNREERAFRMWLNSLGLEDLHVNNLFEDSKEGLLILKAMDKITPGIVTWKSVNEVASNVFKKVENNNYAVVLGKQLKFSLVNIGGKDIVDGNKKLILALVWQLMRLHCVKLIGSLGGGKHQVTEEEMIAWANKTVADSGKSSHLSSFQDSSIKTGVFFLDLLRAVEPDAINPDLVTDGSTQENAEQNAKYVISVARKIGCTIFLLWEDIVDVKPKMILTLVGGIMAQAHKMAAGKK